MKRDWLLVVSIAGGILFSILIILPMANFMNNIYRYHGFVQDLAVSFVYGEENEVLTLKSGDEEWSVRKEQAGTLYTLIVDTGMGHPRKPIPDVAGLTLDFGDGSALQLWPTVIKEKGRQNDTGVLIRYTRSDGKVFSYDTDRLQYEKLVQVFLGGLSETG